MGYHYFNNTSYSNFLINIKFFNISENFVSSFMSQ